MRTPLVSVIVPFFDAARFLAEAIESVATQSYPNWEMLLIDDGSSDGSSALARRTARELPMQVRYLDHDGHRNCGLSATRNLGLRHARGELIALLDADDVWLPHKLERQVHLLQTHPAAALIYGRSEYWHSWQGSAATSADAIPDFGVHIATDMVITPPTLLVLNYPLGLCAAPPPSNLMFRRAMLDRVGGFDESFRGMRQMYEDQVFLTKCYLSEHIYVASECWDRYRQHEASLGTVGARDGHYDAVRHFFLEWLRDYLSEKDVHDADVWRGLHLALWPYAAESDRDAMAAALRRRPPHATMSSSCEGVHDVASCDALSGWAWNPERPADTLTVEIFDGETLLMALPANCFRQDLLAAGKGDGCHAFMCRLPPWLRDGRPHRIWVRVAGSGMPLAGTPQVIACAPSCGDP